MSPSITIKTEADLVQLRIAGRLAADVLAMISSHVKAGISTEALDDICNDYIVNELKVIPANVGYHGFTKTTCISPNTVVCHGIPSPSDILKDGDIINIDVASSKTVGLATPAACTSWVRLAAGPAPGGRHLRGYSRGYSGGSPRGNTGRHWSCHSERCPS